MSDYNTFDLAESSTQDGRPFHLYDFRHGGRHWRYTSTDQQVIYGGEAYEPLPISHGGISQSSDAQQDEFVVTMPADEPMPMKFRGSVPSQTVFLSVREVHTGLRDGPIIWIGSVVEVAQTNTVGVVEVSCRTLAATFLRPGLRLTWGRGCSHMLYDEDCRVPREEFAVEVRVESLAPAFVQVSTHGKPDGWFDGGFLEWSTDPDVFERRGIERQLSTTLQLLGTSDKMTIGMQLRLYPGCNLTTAHCHYKFNNLLNYGGFPHLPEKSPFDGDPVF